LTRRAITCRIARRRVLAPRERFCSWSQDQSLQVRGTARIVNDIDFFKRLIDDLSSLIEPQYAEVGDYPVWQTTMAPKGHIEAQFPLLTPFVVEIETVVTIAKLHQDFPAADRESVAEHLSRFHRDDARAIAERIREQLDR
jgi:transcriptional regulator